MIVGFIYLLIRLVKKTFRKPDVNWLIESMLMITFLVTWAGFLYAITFNGSEKGDSIKATYMLFILPIFVYMPVNFLFRVVKKFKIIFVPVSLWLVLVSAINFWWSWY
jgi:hypothetical protein